MQLHGRTVRISNPKTANGNYWLQIHRYTRHPGYFRKGSGKSARTMQTCKCSSQPETDAQELTDLPDAAKAVAPPPPKRHYESTNMWDYKPAWCQPWTILTTGSAVVYAVNTISSKSVLWTTLSAVPILVWWYLFLYLVPQEFKDYVEQQNASK